MYFTVDDGTTYIILAPGKELDIVAKTLPRRVFASPAISQGKIYLKKRPAFAPSANSQTGRQTALIKENKAVLA